MASTATMTGAEFDALPWEEGRRWELIEGELVEVGSATLEDQLVVQRILARRQSTRPKCQCLVRRISRWKSSQRVSGLRTA